MKTIASVSFEQFPRAEVHQTIPDKFEQIVQQYPDNLAICTRNCRLSYKELNLAADRVAQAILDETGEGTEPVAILTEHSEAAIIAILGVLKAGKFYVPLDPSHPTVRNSYILDDIQTRLVLTDGLNYDRGHALVGRTTNLLNIEALDSPIPVRYIRTQDTPDSLAYVIYTSGSTGTPKGVMQKDRNVLHRVRTYTNGVRISANDRLALLYSYSLAGSVRDIFSALLNGAVLLPFNVRQEGLTSLANWLIHEEITLYNSAATLFRHFAESLPKGTSFPELRSIHLGSETIYKRDVELYKAHFRDDCEFVARLGSTEISPICEYSIGKKTEIPGNTVPAGYVHESAETEILLLDENGREVGLNEIGEITVKSPYLFEGYWGRPDLTQAVIVPDPGGSRIPVFRTGDLGRIRFDGCLEHLGRKDHQVKIRGHRIEIGEIESVLSEHPGVREAALTVLTESSGEKHIAAFIASRSQDATTASHLRDFLRTRLPDYMIPARFLMVDSLARTANGKLDRSKLVSLDVENGDLSPAQIVTGNPVETVLARICSEILGVNEIDLDRDFFELGGNSLQAMQFISRVGHMFDVDLALKTFFEKPTVSGLAVLLATGSHAGDFEGRAREILSGNYDLKDQSVRASNESRIIATRNRSASIPLSLTQQEFWLVDQLNPGSSNNMVHAFRLQGFLHIAALERSLNEVISRHALLRTTFVAVEGTPFQVIAAELTLHLSVMDLAALSGDEQSIEAKRLTLNLGQEVFDLASGPLFRCGLFKLGELEHVFVIAMHHIVSDGWSWGIFLNELTALYEAFSRGEPSPLAPLTIQYSEFAQWQHQRLTESALTDRLSYWQEQLDGAPALLEVPTDYPRSRAQNFYSATEIEIIPPDLTQKLKLLSRTEGVTLFMSLFAAFDALLFRFTGQEDVVVGSTISGRNRTELEHVIGPFINTCVLRSDLSGNPTFRDLLVRVKQVAVGAYINQEIPFHTLIEKLRAKRNVSQKTLFQIFFVLNQESWRRNFTLCGLDVTEIPVETGTTQFDLAVFLLERADDVSCSFKYRTDLFQAATIRRFAAAFRMLLEGAVTNPDAQISELPVLSGAERQEMTSGWNSTAAEYPYDQSIHGLFEKQAKLTPSASAIRFQDQHLSYGELDRKANQLANYLLAAGIHRGSFVSVCMERSSEMIVAFLAVLKAGAAYVPVDPKYATSRLTTALDDTNARLLLSDQRTIGRISVDGIRVICIDSEWDIVSRQPIEKPAIDMAPDDLAYVMYTSGSTGKPKGVEVTHRSVVNFATSISKIFALKPEDRVLQFASISFDTAVEEIFPCLTRGAQLVLRTDSMMDSVPVFLARSNEWGITIWDLPTAFWHELSETVCSEQLSLPEQLRLVVLGGEKVNPTHVSQWLSHTGARVRLLNTYGPTEATVVATTQELSGSEQNSTNVQRAPIGRPIANVQTYILDPFLNPVPTGVTGELHIGGIGLARGYHNRPDETAEKFILNPFGERLLGRLYKTGDLARYLPDGSIEFIGRVDSQLKVRGFRIEPGEIEAVLSKHNTVRLAAVRVRERVSGDLYLVAYVTSRNGIRANEQDLRRFLKEQLPDYMIPHAIVSLDAFPMTATGKIDFNALPEVAENRAEAASAFLPPRTALERELAHEWEEVLGIRPIGVRANFFELGGQSLLAVRLITRIQEKLRKQIPVAALFESPTIEQLSQRLSEEACLEGWSSLLKIQPNGSRPPFFWIHGELSNAVLLRYLDSDQPLYGMEHQGADGRLPEYTSVETIAAHYLSQIRRICPRGPYLLGGFSFGAVAAFEIAQQLTREGERVAFLFLLDPLTRDPEVQPPPISNEIRHHTRTIVRMKPTMALEYIRVRVKEQVINRSAGIRKGWKNLSCRVHMILNRSLPPHLRSFYMLNVYRQAVRNYSPKPYADKVMLYKRSDSSYHPRFDWSNLLGGEVEIYQGSGTHMDMRTEPYVGEWAARLRKCLDGVHKTLRSYVA